MGKACTSASSFLAMIIYLFIFLSSRCKFAHATDTLLPGQALSGNRTLLSKNGAFVLGFNCLSPPCSEFTLGIWYVNSSTCTALLVWAVPDSRQEEEYYCYFTYLTSDPWTSSFGLSDGNLQLTSLTPNYTIIWSSDTGMEGISTAVAVLLDNGNLVIRDQVNSSLFWQSFEIGKSVV